jgi:hypothetical protein
VERLVASAVSRSIVNHPYSVGIAFSDLGTSIQFVGYAFIIIPYIRRLNMAVVVVFRDRNRDRGGDGDVDGDGDRDASVMFGVDHCMTIYVC